jgi:hypothetical protein
LDSSAFHSQVKSTQGLREGEWVALTMGAPTGGQAFMAINMGTDKGCVDKAFCDGDFAFV